MLEGWLMAAMTHLVHDSSLGSLAVGLNGDRLEAVGTRISSTPVLQKRYKFILILTQKWCSKNAYLSTQGDNLHSPLLAFTTSKTLQRKTRTKSPGWLYCPQAPLRSERTLQITLKREHRLSNGTYNPTSYQVYRTPSKRL